MSLTDPLPKTPGTRNPTPRAGTPIGSVIEPHPPLTGYYEGEAQRARYVQQLFDRTAGDYDRIERILGLGSGSWYRRQALMRAGVGTGAAVLDVGCGTGLLAREALHLIGPAGRLVGVDPSPGMLAQARLPRAELLEGTAEALPVEDSSFDFVTLGYALRHIGDLQAAFAEFHRVLKPGGTLLILEIGKPAGVIGRAVLKAYMRGLVPLLATVVGRDKSTPALWRYFWDTIEACVPAQRILDTMLGAGFSNVRRQVELGLFGEYLGRKSLGIGVVGSAGSEGSAVKPTGTSIGTSTGTSRSL